MILRRETFFYEKFLKRTFQYLFQRYITLRVFSHYLLLLINLFKIKTIITLMYLISLFLIYSIVQYHVSLLNVDILRIEPWLLTPAESLTIGRHSTKALGLCDCANVTTANSCDILPSQPLRLWANLSYFNYIGVLEINSSLFNFDKNGMHALSKPFKQSS